MHFPGVQRNPTSLATGLAPDRIAGTLLVAGAFLMALGRSHVAMPLLILGQVLTLLGSRRSRPLALVLIGWPATTVSTGWVFFGAGEVVFGSVTQYLLRIALVSLLYVGTLLADRWLVSRLPRVLAPLGFPAIRVPLEALTILAGPFGAWGAFAAPAAGMWPLSRLAAIGGMTLLSFMLLWLASSVARFWQGVQDDGPSRRWIVLMPCLAALLGCNLALVDTGPRGSTLRVAAVAGPRPVETFDGPAYENLVGYGQGRIPAGALSGLRHDLIAAARGSLDLAAEAARGGARIVYTAEGDATLLDVDWPAVERMASERARDSGIWLGLGLRRFERRGRPLANAIVLFSPSGQVVGYYAKRHALGNEARTMQTGATGPLAIRAVGSSISSVVCYDTEFVQDMRSVARDGADILFAPSNDWQDIAMIRAAITRFRALETGMALVRPTSRGISEIVAANGKVQAEAPYDPIRGTVLIADVPSRKSPTLYVRLGDWPGAVALCLLLLLTGYALARDPARAPPALGSRPAQGHLSE